MTEKELNKMARKYQKVLGLQDWDVVVMLNDFRNMDGNVGRVEWFIDHKRAVIEIADDKTLPPDLTFPYDQEETIVHELLHLHSAPFDTFEKESHENNALEVMINKLSSVIVKLKRG